MCDPAITSATDVPVSSRAARPAPALTHGPQPWRRRRVPAFERDPERQASHRRDDDARSRAESLKDSLRLSPRRSGTESSGVGRLRAVGFDLDGTLFDHRTSARLGAERFLRGLGLVVTDAALDIWFAAEEEQFERWRSGEISFQEQRRRRLRSVLPALGHALGEDEDLDSLFEGYLQHYRDAWRSFPESIALLGDLRRRGYRLGLLTNGGEDQQLAKVARIGLGEAFDVVCTSERIGFAKPDARAFLILANDLAVEASECLFVGDDLEKDVLGARSAGMRALFVDHDQSGRVDLRTAVLAALEAEADPS